MVTISLMSEVRGSYNFSLDYELIASKEAISSLLFRSYCSWNGWSRSKSVYLYNRKQCPVLVCLWYLPEQLRNLGYCRNVCIDKCLVFLCEILVHPVPCFEFPACEMVVLLHTEIVLERGSVIWLRYQWISTAGPRFCSLDRTSGIL